MRPDSRELDEMQFMVQDRITVIGQTRSVECVCRQRFWLRQDCVRLRESCSIRTNTETQHANSSVLLLLLLLLLHPSCSHTIEAVSAA